MEFIYESKVANIVVINSKVYVKEEKGQTNIVFRYGSHETAVEMAQEFAAYLYGPVESEQIKSMLGR